MNCKAPVDGCWKMGFLNFNELSKQTYCSRQMHTFPPLEVVGEWNPGVRQASWSENALKPRNPALASKLPTKLALFFLSLLFISPIKILLIPSAAYELAKSLRLSFSTETEEILLLLLNAAVQVLPADKVKKQLQMLVTIYEGHTEFLVAEYQKQVLGYEYIFNISLYLRTKIWVKRQVKWWDFSIVRKKGTKVMFRCEHPVCFVLQDQTILKMSILEIAVEFSNDKKPLGKQTHFLKDLKMVSLNHSAPHLKQWATAGHSQIRHAGAAPNHPASPPHLLSTR